MRLTGWVRLAMEQNSSCSERTSAKLYLVASASLVFRFFLLGVEDDVVVVVGGRAGVGVEEVAVEGAIGDGFDFLAPIIEVVLCYTRLCEVLSRDFCY